MQHRPDPRPSWTGDFGNPTYCSELLKSVTGPAGAASGLRILSPYLTGSNGGSPWRVSGRATDGSTYAKTITQNLEPAFRRTRVVRRLHRRPRGAAHRRMRRSARAHRSEGGDEHADVKFELQSLGPDRPVEPFGGHATPRSIGRPSAFGLAPEVGGLVLQPRELDRIRELGSLAALAVCGAALSEGTARPHCPPVSPATMRRASWCRRRRTRADGRAYPWSRRSPRASRRGA